MILKLFNSINNEGLKNTLKKIFLKIKNHFIFDYSDFAYKSEYQDNIDFSSYKTDTKPIAFYLPQFHTIPENDQWWGTGFTEWTNTKKAKPLFKGHYQPRKPHKDFGYYNLTDIDVIKKQAQLAKQHGIYGFCFYYYWFSGKRLLEKPLDLLLEHPKIDINFCLCWANENWTRTWDGKEKKILIKQEYNKDDPKNFINDIKKYICDKRYIKVNGKPVILVYNPGSIPDVKNVFLTWKKHSDIEIWICKTFEHTIESLGLQGIADAMVEFPPHGIPKIEEKFNIKFFKKGSLFNFKELVKKTEEKNKKTNYNYPVYRSCMTGWDNSPRKKNKYSIYAGFSLILFYKWISLITAELKNKKEKIFFINAWNEWAESTYLEPDAKYGYACINTLSKAVFKQPFYDKLIVANENAYENQALAANNDKAKKINKKRIVFFAHFNQNNIISDNDLILLKSLQNIAEYIVFISNSKFENESLPRINKYANKIILRENIGFDFGAWKDGLKEFGFDNLKNYEQLILINNSILGPVYNLENMFNTMDNKNLDFWGITLFPECNNKTYIKKSTMNVKEIKEHIQSYFIVYEKKLFTDELFKNYWLSMSIYNDYIDLIQNIEINLTYYFASRGFKYDVYIKESKLLTEYLNSFDIPYEYPYALAVLGSPFIKKKFKEYASYEECIKVNEFLLKLGINESI